MSHVWSKNVERCQNQQIVQTGGAHIYLQKHDAQYLWVPSHWDPSSPKGSWMYKARMSNVRCSDMEAITGALGIKRFKTQSLEGPGCCKQRLSDAKCLKQEGRLLDVKRPLCSDMGAIWMWWYHRVSRCQRLQSRAKDQEAVSNKMPEAIKCQMSEATRMATIRCQTMLRSGCQMKLLNQQSPWSLGIKHFGAQ